MHECPTCGVLADGDPGLHRCRHESAVIEDVVRAVEEHDMGALCDALEAFQLDTIRAAMEMAPDYLRATGELVHCQATAKITGGG